MSDPNPRQPDRKLADPRFRAALLTKVESLIAVLELAKVKVKRNLEVPGCNRERLARILDNVRNTLAVCRRAQLVLLRQESQPGGDPVPGETTTDIMSGREFLEISSLSEFERLKQLGPISDLEVRTVDLEDLCDRLGKVEPPG